MTTTLGTASRVNNVALAIHRPAWAKWALAAVIGAAWALGTARAQAQSVVIWRPSTGVWWILNRVTGVAQTRQWGQQGDIPVPADYDGDGLTDFAVWRPSDAGWYRINSSNGQGWVTHWGQAGDIPVPGHYFQSDGAVELTVFRPSNGTWYVFNTQTGASSSRHWGQNGDVPVPGFYHTTVPTGPLAIRSAVPAFAVYRPSNAVWYVNDVGTGWTFTSTAWDGPPLSTQVAAPGDYNGDGATDFAVWRPDSFSSAYLIMNSNFSTAPSGALEVGYSFGSPGDIPVPGDYDGDGITDRTLWRPSTGLWSIVQSHNGVLASVQWGVSGDIPVYFK